MALSKTHTDTNSEDLYKQHYLKYSLIYKIYDTFSRKPEPRIYEFYFENMAL